MSITENGNGKRPWTEDDLAKVPLANANLPTRECNALERAGIRTANDLMRLKPEDLLRIKGIGDAALDRVQRAMRILLAKDPDDTSDSPPESTNDQEAAVIIATLRELDRKSGKTNTDKASDELVSLERAATHERVFGDENSLRCPKGVSPKRTERLPIRISSINETFHEAFDS